MNVKYQKLTPQQIEDYTHLISFSGGRTSGYLLIKELEKRLPRKYLIRFANTGKESEETLEFVRDCDNYIQEKFGKKIIWLEMTDYSTNELKFKEVDFNTASRDGTPLRKAIEKHGYLPNRMLRFCTQYTKIRTMSEHAKSIGLDLKKTIIHIGIRFDEPKRFVTANETGDIIYHPLVEAKVTKPMVLDFWKNEMPFDLKLEEPFGNCDLCFLKSPNKRVAVIKKRPESVEFWKEMEAKTKKKFDNGFSVNYLERLALGKQELTKGLEAEANRPDIDCICNID